MVCAEGSTCCQSRNKPGEALCCGSGSACRFSFFNGKAGVSVLNALGMGSPRCFACDDKQGGCADPHGGSLFHGPLVRGTEPVEGIPQSIAEINALGGAAALAQVDSGSDAPVVDQVGEGTGAALLQETDSSGSFRCGAMVCAEGSTCCQS